MCFYDDIYFCFCETYYRRAECFLHRVEVHECRHCLSGGKCLPGDGNFSYNFICACSSCHEGDRCELNLEPFGFTLDSLLLDFSLQRKIIYQIFVYLLVGFGLFNNHCSFLTFRRSSPRIFGTGTYLLSVACLNQMALICILGKFVEISFGLHNRFSCKTIPYLLSVFTRSTYWLNSWISVNRCLVIFLPVSPIVRSSRIAVVISFLTVFLVLGMHVHELLCYIKIERSSGAVLCVTDFQSQFIATYNRTSTVFHYLVPFIIQTVTVTILIVFAARSRARVGDRNKSFFKVMKKQFDTQKELYITPTIILISALPIIILAFSLACVKLTDWQTHMLLVAYLLSYAPQVLGFVLYVLASTSYKREFCETSFGKSFKRFLLKETRERSISKRKTATAKI